MASYTETLENINIRLEKIEVKYQMQSDLLIRIDENVKSLVKQGDEFKAIYVTRDEFLPVQSIAYGMVGVILITVLGVLLRQIFIKKPLR